MKALLILLITTFFFIGCGSKKKMNDSAKTEGTKAEAAAETENKKADSMTTSAGAVSCMMKSDKRVIDVRKQGSGCELAYNKFGSEEIVATSMNGADHCQKIADRIQGNLENAGFKCE